jgi:hypothetical protein
MLNDKGFAEAMETTSMFLYIYSGTVPATADAAALTANHLCTISTEDSENVSLEFAAPTAGTISMTGVWSGEVATSGTATFFRLVGNCSSETDGLSQMNAGSSAYCIQGTVGVSGCDLNLVSTALVSGNTQTIEYFVVSFPTD